MKEGGIDLSMPGWWAVFAPAGVPKPIVEKLHDEFSAVISTDESRKFFNQLANDPLVTTLDQARKIYQDEVNGIKVKAVQLDDASDPSTGTRDARKLIEQGRIPRDEEIVLCITGNGLKTQDAVFDALEQPAVIAPTLAAFEQLAGIVKSEPVLV